MFAGKALSMLLKNNRSTLSELVALGAALNERFADMEDAVECLVLSVASGEPMLLVGPPGTAKSRLIRTFCNLIGVIPDDAFVAADGAPAGKKRELHAVDRSPLYFSYLLTQFTEPSELFGYFDISKLMNEPHVLVKLDELSMQRAQIVFLDEVFNASSAILNALLTFMNEREVHDRGTVYKVPLQSLFSATNHVPRTPELKAVFDRFLLRCWLDNERATPDKMRKLLRTGWKETYAPPIIHADDGSKSSADRIPDQVAGLHPARSRHTENGSKSSFDGLLDRVAALHRDIEKLSRSGELAIQEDNPLFAVLADIVHHVRQSELSDASNRRLIKFTRLFLINRLLDYARDGKFDVASPEMKREDLAIFIRFGLDHRDLEIEQNLLKEIAISKETGQRWPKTDLHDQDADLKQEDATGSADNMMEEAAELEVSAEGDKDDSDTARALIEELLERPGISDQFREELEGYQTDIGTRDFEKKDEQYIRALYARLK
jgi:MoxR-like ATPase